MTAHRFNAILTIRPRTVATDCYKGVTELFPLPLSYPKARSKLLPRSYERRILLWLIPSPAASSCKAIGITPCAVRLIAKFPCANRTASTTGAAVLSVAAAGLLSSCGGSSTSNGGSTGAAGNSSTYTVLYSRQPATLNYLVCSADPDLYHGTQCIDTLVEYDNRGKIREGLATAWEWDADSLTWTFHLRDENWVDCNGEVLGPVTAQDFVDALAYVLNPDYASSTASLVTPYVAGADDYYNYCVYRNNANNGTVAEDGTTYAIDANGTVTAAAADGTTTEYPAVDFSTVGVKAVDDHTLTYTLNFDFPGFLSLLSYAPYEPAYGPLLEEFADQFCTSAETACSCGAFYLAEYTPLENWVMTKYTRVTFWQLESVIGRTQRNMNVR